MPDWKIQKCQWTRALQRMSCRGGAYSANINSTTCLTCGVGKFLPNASSVACTSRETGKYSPIVSSVACISCETGKYSTNVSSVVCTPCEIGKTHNLTGQTSNVNCLAICPNDFITNGDKCISINGILGHDGDVCCPAECGECGVSGCSSRPGGEDSCCLSHVKEAGVQCGKPPGKSPLKRGTPRIVRRHFLTRAQCDSGPLICRFSAKTNMLAGVFKVT